MKVYKREGTLHTKGIHNFDLFLHSCWDKHKIAGAPVPSVSYPQAPDNEEQWWAKLQRAGSSTRHSTTPLDCWAWLGSGSARAQFLPWFAAVFFSGAASRSRVLAGFPASQSHVSEKWEGLGGSSGGTVCSTGPESPQRYHSYLSWSRGRIKCCTSGSTFLCSSLQNHAPGLWGKWYRIAIWPCPHGSKLCPSEQT